MIETTEKYWDCECDRNYIHPKTEEVCLLCGAHREEQPDSHTNEVPKESSNIMYCPDCGSKMRVMRNIAIPHGSWDESIILYHCDNCDDEWQYETDTMEQGAKLVKIM